MEKLCCSQEVGAFVVVKQAQLSQLNVGMFGVEDGGSPSILTVIRKACRLFDYCLGYMTWRALTLWPVASRSSSVLIQTSWAASPLGGYGCGSCGRADSWHAVAIFLAHFTCQSLGFATWKIAKTACIIHQAAGIRCWSKLRAAFCASFIRGN